MQLSSQTFLILLNKNFDQFIFIFFKECFLKRALFRLENYPQFSSLFHCCQRYLLQDTKRNALDISDFRNQVHHINVLGSRWQIRLDRLRVIIYINFGSSQPPFLFQKSNYWVPNHGNFDKSK